MGIIAFIVIGLLAGLIARAILPGNQSMGLVATTLLGIVGSFVGGFLADVFFRSETEDVGLRPASFVGSVIGGIVVLLIYRAVSGRSRRTI